MLVTKRYNQHRRDLWVDLECESCHHEQTAKSAYDDRNYWDNVVPNMKCESCNKSTKDLGLEPEIMPTKYPEGYQI